MQQARVLLSRQTPRAFARLAVSGHSQLTGMITISTNCSHVLAPTTRLPSHGRLFASEATARSQPAEEAAEEEYVPTAFASYGNVHPKTMQAIRRVMRFDTASKVQDQVISRMPLENDIMVKAKTGTGKTLAFLVPAIEALANEYKRDPERARKGREIGCLIISPTRELAKQIAVEAEKLVKFHRWNVQLLVGGESSRGQLRDLQNRHSDIVIGTPGRLLDFLQSQPAFAEQLAKGKVLVLDEADVLLDMGFRKELDWLIPAMAKDRKTLLVSATLGQNVQSLASTVCSDGFDLIDCVGQEETNTHANVKQEYVSVPFSQQLPVLMDLIETHTTKNNAESCGSKIVIFLPTIKATSMYAEIINAMLADKGGKNRQVDVFELHGGVPQTLRSSRSDRFRSASLRAGNTSILVTTDVSARGVDYPDVSMVIQVGIPSTTEAYIHRLGRTGRAGKSGEGVIMLSPVEMPFLKEISDVLITESQKYTPKHIADVCDFQNGPLKHLASRWNFVTSSINVGMLTGAYTSLLSFYATHASMIGRPPIQNIVDATEAFFVPFKLPPPELSTKLREMLGMESATSGGFGSRDGHIFRDHGEQGFGSQSDRRFGSRQGQSIESRSREMFGSRSGQSIESRGREMFGSRRFGSQGDRSFGNRGEGIFGKR